MESRHNYTQNESKEDSVAREQIEKARSEKSATEWREYMEILTKKAVDAGDAALLKNILNYTRGRMDLGLKSLPDGASFSPNSTLLVKELQKGLELRNRLPSAKELSDILNIAISTLEADIKKAEREAGVSSLLELAFFNTKTDPNSQEPNHISCRLIAIPDGVKITPTELNVIKQIRKMVEQASYKTQKELAYDMEMNKRAFESNISNILKKFPMLQSFIQLAFLDVSEYKTEDLQEDQGKEHAITKDKEERYNPFKDPDQSLERTRAELEIKTPKELNEAKKKAGVVTFPEHLARLIEDGDPGLVRHALQIGLRNKTEGSKGIIEHSSRSVELPLQKLLLGKKLTPRQKQFVKILREGLIEKNRSLSDEEIFQRLDPKLKKVSAISSYLHLIVDKTGVKSRFDLALLDTEEEIDPKDSGRVSVNLISIPNGVKLSPR